VKILEITLHTHDLKLTKDFYINRLDFPLLQESDTSFTVRIGHTELSFTASNTDKIPLYHFAINISPDKIQAARQWLKSRVDILQYENEDVYYYPDWNSSSLYFYDTVGNIVELIARHNMPDESPRSLFSQDDFIGISEIGVPVHDVIADAEYIAAKTGITLWKTPHSSFTTLGDEEGLLILVPKGRKWFMTDKEADLYPLSIKFESTKNNEITIHDYHIRSRC
jgi:catechol-2,3-dioxygenase